MSDESGTETPQALFPSDLREAILILLVIALIELLKPWAEAMNEIEPHLDQAEATARRAGYRAALYWRVITDGR